jgi:hypothetical protein
MHTSLSACSPLRRWRFCTLQTTTDVTTTKRGGAVVSVRIHGVESATLSTSSATFCDLRPWRGRMKRPGKGRKEGKEQSGRPASSYQPPCPHLRTVPVARSPLWATFDPIHSVHAPVGPDGLHSLLSRGSADLLSLPSATHPPWDLGTLINQSIATSLCSLSLPLSLYTRSRSRYAASDPRFCYPLLPSPITHHLSLIAHRPPPPLASHSSRPPPANDQLMTPPHLLAACRRIT